MAQYQETIIIIKKYLKKMIDLIKTDTVFRFGNTCIVNKQKLDDIFCCIDGTWPKEFKAYCTTNGLMRLKTSKYYSQLLEVTKIQFLFFTGVYAVKKKETLVLINSIINSIDADVETVLGE